MHVEHRGLGRLINALPRAATGVRPCVARDSIWVRRLRCVACGLETTQRPLSRCTFTPEDLDEQFDGAIGYLVEPADSPIVSRPGLGLQPPVNQAATDHMYMLSGAVGACSGAAAAFYTTPCDRA